MTEQLIADILAIKHRQDLTAQAAVREKAEKAQAEEEFKKLVAKRWASTKTQLLDAASTLNQAFKPGGIEVNGGRPGWHIVSGCHAHSCCARWS